MELLVVDCDDTLWSTGFMYEEAIDEFVDEFVGYSRLNPGTAGSQGLEKAIVRKVFSQIDIERAARRGFNQDGFAESMLQTLEQYRKRGIVSGFGQDFTAKIWAIGHKPFDRVSPPTPGVEEFLNAFRVKGIPIVALTMGDDAIQHKRLNDFPFKSLLDGARVVPRKNADTLRELLADQGVAPRDAWMVGNSYKVDILPALQVGANAAWLSGYTWGFDTADIPDYDPSVFVADSLQTIADHILKQEGYEWRDMSVLGPSPVLSSPISRF